ncbi:DUF2059 domain-containing protein [Sphingomonas sp. ABOLE]|uniref:DUF2059 domain-containing protein n=1 Tax=Sphingomonas sp. ABOLE TaxID=1985878 RepID=UPI000F7D8D9E|nr:DUF2059 domain-containing protein [Sphingomonas sp. ABOLE]RSV42216.1 DUF2059 domain-containing protein [Sphingomonas sp. ABOLE]
MKALATALLLAAASPALAQTQPPAASAPAAAAPDPARLAVARELADKLIPQGMYQRMLGGNFNRMMESMVGSAAEIQMRDFAQMGGMSEAEVAALGQTTLREVMEIYDPYWQERQQRMMRSMMGEMGKLMSTLEPKVRVALARAYAREYTLPELQALQRFFATPAGSHYARSSMELMMGPDMAQTMAEAMPEIMKQMPALVQAAQAGTKDLPPPRKAEDLTPQEREKILKLLGAKSAPPAKK